jgi:hypothetical protein
VEAETTAPELNQPTGIVYRRVFVSNGFALRVIRCVVGLAVVLVVVLEGMGWGWPRFYGLAAKRAARLRSGAVYSKS